jgi:hypothetical protein
MWWQLKICLGTGAIFVFIYEIFINEVSMDIDWCWTRAYINLITRQRNKIIS